EFAETLVPGASPGTTGGLTCQGARGCWLFFVDTNHWAHFAHTTVLALWEIESGSFKPLVVGEWWPLLNGEPIFNTVISREDWYDDDYPDPDRTIVYPRNLSKNKVPMFTARDPVGISVGRPRSSRIVVADTVPGAAAEDACRVWAIVVTGFDDETDTFHIDTAGMYQVLRGQGIPDDQIIYLCPNPDTTPGCEIVVNEGNLEGAFGTLDAAIPVAADLGDSECQELVFFYSSHGGSDYLWCDLDTPDSDFFKQRFDGVRCAKITTVVEACKSGWLIDKLSGSPAAPIPAGQTRVFFTSTDQDSESYRDLDTTDDDKDKNPGDTGSETIWGYIEALGSRSSDTDGDRTVSFNEATDYAILHDLSMTLGNVPGVDGVGSGFPGAPSCLEPGEGELKIELIQDPSVTSAGAGEIFRCRCNKLKAKVSKSDAGSKPPNVAAARFFWTNAAWTADEMPSWAFDDSGDFHEIKDATRILTNIDDGPEIDIQWEIGTGTDPGTEIILLAVVGSPNFVPTTPPTDFDNLVSKPWADAVKLKVVNPSSCCLFPCKGGNRRCEPQN
ncbi:MAG: hypothetical protein QNL88_04185, partial [Acidobacteriota bacterium]|nr:hypothetical protein [Acidobacteriota bacterium]